VFPSDEIYKGISQPGSHHIVSVVRARLTFPKIVCKDGTQIEEESARISLSLSHKTHVLVLQLRSLIQRDEELRGVGVCPSKGQGSATILPLERFKVDSLLAWLLAIPTSPRLLNLRR
jgi:hypothetical protein